MLGYSFWMDAYFIIVAAVLGAVMGSFFNAFAWRVVHGENIASGRSHCAVCNHPLHPLDLVPVFSWIFLGGKCRYCGTKISPRYLAIEVLGAVIFVSLLLRFDVSVELLQWLTLACILLLLSLIDFESFIIPDQLLITALILYVPFQLIMGINSIFGFVIHALAGGLAVSLPLLLLVLLADRILGKETMGGGDIKLFFVLGVYFGPLQTLLILFISCLVGITGQLILNRVTAGQPFPFGPSISVASWIVMLWGTQLVHWYLRFLGF